MIFRDLDEDGDWEFGRGIGCYTEQNQAIGLNVKTRLLSWLNDCFFALNDGVDWFNRLGSKNQRILLEQDIQRIILQSIDVTGILSFDTVLVGRSFTANYSVETVFSQSFQDTLTLEV